MTAGSRRLDGLLALATLCVTLATTAPALANELPIRTVDIVQTNTNLIPVSINNSNQVSAHINFFMVYGDIWRFDPVLGGVELYDQQVAFSGTCCPPINASGAVAFYHRAGSEEEVVYGNGGVLTVIATQAQIADFTQFTFDDLDMNDAGQVVFLADLPWANPGTQRGLFRGNDPVNDAILLEGDVLAGRDVRDIDLHHGGLNDLGEVAFITSELEGGSLLFRGIYRADITAMVPTLEWGGWLALASCLVGLALIAQARRRAAG